MRVLQDRVRARARVTCTYTILLASCATADLPPPAAPLPPPRPIDAPMTDAIVDSVPDAAVDANAPQEAWLKGSTHVHAKPSGDSSEPIVSVVQWYEQHGYDFIALTDHNRVTEVAGDTTGQPAVATSGLIVLAGIELTHNPSGCQPQGDASKKCRIHVNVLGPTARPNGRQEWAERHSKQRVDMYQAAIAEATRLGGNVIQINHPQWYWGMTPDVLVEIAQRGAHLFEIENVQFDKWNAGDAAHPSTEALWDAALLRGAMLWGVASDDAHDYEHPGKYPAGGAWVMVKARRDPRAILDALAQGHFYSSTGVVLVRAEVEAGDLVVEAEPGAYTIAWIENGVVVDTAKAVSARRALPQSGYLRAVVTRDDGKRAWVQPARR